MIGFAKVVRTLIPDYRAKTIVQILPLLALNS